MKFNDYQNAASKYAKYPPEYKAIYPVLGLVGEAGEVAEKMKKIIRDKNGEISEQDSLEIQKELGDVLWYISEIARQLNVNLSDIAKTNIDKLESRYVRNKINGSGDNR